jgi:RHS repeat-associated protein
LSGVVTINFVFYSPGDRIADCSQASGALIREYVWLNGEPLAVIEGGVVNFVRVDHIGRPVFATNSSVTKTWTASYLPFGEVRTTTGTPFALRFPGQWFQSESGLHQNWMRDYDPTTGRYLEADPLGLVDGASIYGYVKGNPGRWVDPKGLLCSYYSRADGTTGIDCSGPTTYCPSGECGFYPPTFNNPEYDSCVEECGTLEFKVGTFVDCTALGALVGTATGPAGSFICSNLCKSAVKTFVCRRKCAP